ncbi:MAG: sensor histidine kinase, partial [Thermoanaerobaculia bacterium]
SRWRSGGTPAPLQIVMNDQRWRLTPRELFIIFLFWTSLATLSSVSRTLDPRGAGFRPVSPAGPIALSYVEAWIWAAFTPLIFWLSSRFSLEGSKWLTRVPILIAIGVVVSIAVYALIGLARTEIFEVPARRAVTAFAPLRDIGRFRFVNQLLMYLSILAAGYAREYFRRDQQRQREADVMQTEAAKLQAQLADARLDALRMQINPHFLFNTLHAISALVERDPGGVRRMIARLSELLRYTIESRGADEVTLRDELSFLRRYIEIMEIRFQGRLRVDTTIADDTLEALVPNLILQPLVENALEHGFSRVAGEGRIEITARRDDENLEITIRDNGPGIEREQTGVGLTNTRARLSQLYGDASALSLAPAAGGGTLATIVVPFHTAHDLRATEQADD